MTIIGCTLSITNQSAIVDSQTKALVSVEPLAIKTSSDWQAPTPAFNPDKNNNSQVDAVSSMSDCSAFFMTESSRHVQWQEMIYIMPFGSIGSQVVTPGVIIDIGSQLSV
jgi:hypothetical protein